MNDSERRHTSHVLPIRVYLTIGAALLALTAVTVIVARFDFGAWNLVVAMLIAATKGSLVAAYFMHLKYDNKFYAMVFAFGLAFLAVCIAFTMADTERREDIELITSGSIKPLFLKAIKVWREKKPMSIILGIAISSSEGVNISFLTGRPFKKCSSTR